MGYLGLLEDYVPGTRFIVTDASRDGTVVAGVYNTIVDAPLVRSEGWLWTQATGIIGLRELLSENELVGRRTNRSVVSMSSDGHQILIAGWDETNLQPLKYRAAILRLVAKTSRE